MHDVFWCRADAIPRIRDAGCQQRACSPENLSVDEQPVLWLMAQLYDQVGVVELQCRQQKIE